MAEQQIETAIEINAPPSRVWSVLTDFSAMPTWNPFIRAISGRLQADARLLIELAPPGKRRMSFRPKVLRVLPARELRWLGTLLIPGLFNGEHYFLLQPMGEATTRFVHGEKFSGLLVGPFARRGMLEATRQGFDAMNMALKERAEARGQ
jgi:hypothetical protein